MRVKDAMTKDPTCCLPSDSAQRTAIIMRNEHVGIVPVIENEQSRKVVGVVTDRDLCMNVIAEGRDPKSVTVDACMTTKIVACAPSDSVDKATELMRENQIRRVLVCNDQHELVGIVALADVVKQANVKMAQTHETLKQVSAPTEEASKPRAQSKQAA